MSGHPLRGDDVLAGLLTLWAQHRAGDRLPAERDLAERFGVGRAVVRRALRELSHRELIATSRQVGSFVRGDDRSAGARGRRDGVVDRQVTPAAPG